jgi:hypothetical protein
MITSIQLNTNEVLKFTLHKNRGLIATNQTTRFPHNCLKMRVIIVGLSPTINPTIEREREREREREAKF